VQQAQQSFIVSILQSQRFESLMFFVSSTFLHEWLKISLYSGYAYIGSCCFAFLFQRKLQYFPDRSEYRIAGGSCENIHFETETADGVKLKGIYIAPDPEKHFCEFTILQLHGNAGNIYHRFNWAMLVHKRFGCGIVLLDYRGFGASSGRISENGLILDAHAGVDWIKKLSPISCTIVLHLESIGTAVALNISANLCTRPEVKGVVVEGGLCSCEELAQELFPFLPVCYILKDKWTGVRKAASELSHLSHFMSLHGATDEIVPLSHGRELFESVASRNKILRCFPRGGHNDLSGHPGYFGSLNAFYSKLLGPVV